MMPQRPIGYRRSQAAGQRRQEGFTLLETMIAMVVMAIGLLAMVASFATAIRATASAEEDLVARHKALDALESIYTARNSQQVPFSSINNVSSGGIFLSGARPLLCAGPDGLVGTADDVSCNSVDNGTACPQQVECQVLPGPDGILGTTDDVTVSLTNFTRTIAFSPVLLSTGVVNADLIAVTVTVTYQKPGWPLRNYSVSGLVSSYY
jgi:prepilin-type N-terminal cleavage/methylation domain-containing protein